MTGLGRNGEPGSGKAKSNDKSTIHRVAWITGAGKGIGRGLALRLARAGWHVAASARTKADLDSLRAEAPAGRIHVFPLDITDGDAAAATLASMVAAGPGLPELAVLNAGDHVPTPAHDFDPVQVRRLLDTNLMGTVNCLAPLMARFMERQSGHIAVVASLAGYRGLPGAAAYGAGKAGLINLCEALRPELELYGVRLSLINPGFVKTPLTDKNRFPMPFLISVEQAVDYIMRALESRRFEAAFPRRFALIMKLLRILPDPLFFALTRRMIAKPTPEGEGKRP